MKPPFPPDAAPFQYSPDPDDHHRVSWPLWRFGMILFLASLAMLFAASLLGFLAIRFSSPTAPPPGWLRLPPILWLSTIFLLASGLAIAIAQRAARRPQTNRLRRALLAASLLAAAFIASQAPAMLRLLADHHQHFADQTGLYGIIFALSLLHALHVLGGLIPLALLTRRALRDDLQPAHRKAISATALYWHFLEAVWLTMFATFLLTA